MIRMTIVPGMFNRSGVISTSTALRGISISSTIFSNYRSMSCSRTINNHDHDHTYDHSHAHNHTTCDMSYDSPCDLNRDTNPVWVDMKRIYSELGSINRILGQLMCTIEHSNGPMTDPVSKKLQLNTLTHSRRDLNEMVKQQREMLPLVCGKNVFDDRTSRVERGVRVKREKIVKRLVHLDGLMTKLQTNVIWHSIIDNHNLEIDIVFEIGKTKQQIAYLNDWIRKELASEVIDVMVDSSKNNNQAQVSERILSKLMRKYPKKTTTRMVKRIINSKIKSRIKSRIRSKINQKSE